MTEIIGVEPEPLGWIHDHPALGRRISDKPLSDVGKSRGWTEIPLYPPTEVNQAARKITPDNQLKNLANRLEFILDQTASATDRVGRRACLTNHDLRTLLIAVRHLDEFDYNSSFGPYEAKGYMVLFKGTEDCRWDWTWAAEIDAKFKNLRWVALQQEENKQRKKYLDEFGDEDWPINFA